MRTIWVYKETPGLPVKPSAFPKRPLLFNRSQTVFEVPHGGGADVVSVRASLLFLYRP